MLCEFYQVHILEESFPTDNNKSCRVRQEIGVFELHVAPSVLLYVSFHKIQ